MSVFKHVILVKTEVALNAVITFFIFLKYDFFLFLLHIHLQNSALTEFW